MAGARADSPPKRVQPNWGPTVEVAEGFAEEALNTRPGLAQANTVWSARLRVLWRLLEATERQMPRGVWAFCEATERQTQKFHCTGSLRSSLTCLAVLYPKHIVQHSQKQKSLGRPPSVKGIAGAAASTHRIGGRAKNVNVPADDQQL